MSEPRKFITIANMKGGVGKTTTSIGLANALHKMGHKVEVRDLDPQGSASLWADKAERNGTPLPFPVAVSNKFTVGKDAADPDTWVIIDTPPSLPDLVGAAFDASTLAILVSTPGVLDLERMKETAERINCAASVLLTQVRRNTKTFHTAEQFIADNDLASFDTVIEYREALRRASNGEPFPSASGYEDVALELLDAWKDM